MIDRISPQRPALPVAGDVSRSRVTVPTTVEAAPPVSETVSLLVTEPRRLAGEGPPVDAARVAQLRAAIADGSYGIDPERIAAAMLASEQR
jgi:negative regulator of flagellin synthesis FlgM